MSTFRLANPRMFAKAFHSSSMSIPHSNETTYTIEVPSNSYNLQCSTAPRSIDVDVNLKIQMAVVVSLLQLGLFCCLSNPKARPSMGEVNRLLHQIRDIKYESFIMTILMPSLPTTKPLGLYDPSEFSSSTILSNYVAPSPSSLV